MKLVIIRGLPGSGKSTLAGKFVKNCPEVWEHFEADMFFIDFDGIYTFVPSDIKAAHHWCRSETRRALQHGYNVVVSNTFTTKWEIQPYFDIASEFDIIPEVILLQNDYGSVHDVPEETLEKMKNRFEYDISELFS